MSGEQDATTTRDLLEGLMAKHGVTTQSALADRLGLNYSTVAGWAARGGIPEKHLRAPVRPAIAFAPWQLLAALSVLRDDALTDAEARKSAEGFLKQLEVAHV